MDLDDKIKGIETELKSLNTKRESLIREKLHIEIPEKLNLLSKRVKNKNLGELILASISVKNGVGDSESYSVYLPFQGRINYQLIDYGYYGHQRDKRIIREDNYSIKDIKEVMVLERISINLDSYLLKYS